MASWTLWATASLQLVTAALFFSIGAVAYRYGGEAQRTAEREVERQGHPRQLLGRAGVNFDESALGASIPVAIGLVLVALATLNIAGAPTGRFLSWVFQPMLLVVGGWITGNQVFATRQVQSAFASSGDDELASVDVAAVMSAALCTFPAWFRFAIVARFCLVTAGSAGVLVLLAIQRGAR